MRDVAEVDVLLIENGRHQRVGSQEGGKVERLVRAEREVELKIFIQAAKSEARAVVPNSHVVVIGKDGLWVPAVAVPGFRLIDRIRVHIERGVVDRLRGVRLRSNRLYVCGWCSNEPVLGELCLSRYGIVSDSNAGHHLPRWDEADEELLIVFEHGVGVESGEADHEHLVVHFERGAFFDSVGLDRDPEFSERGAALVLEGRPGVVADVQ